MADAALLIGDPRSTYEGGVERIDLGEEWTRVDRAAVRLRRSGPGPWAPCAPRRLRAAAARPGVGLRARSTRSRGRRPGGDPDAGAEYQAYLRDEHVYRLGEAELAGLPEFFRRAAAPAWCRRVPEIRFHALA